MRRQKLGRKAKKTLRPPNTPKITRPRSSVITVDETSAERLARDHREALEQQAATNEVLRIIRRSPADAQPVFDAIVESASRLCGAIFSAVYLCEDDRFRIVATNNFSREATRQILEHGQWRKPDRSHIAGRAMLDRAIRHVPDVLADPEYSREWALAGGWRAVVAVPLLRDNKPLGVLSVSKAEPVPFSDWQIQLLNTFADQALIAIENVRLFEAERQRTQELSEALDRQTATSEVLQVISSSPGELEPVFNIMLEKATRTCDAEFGTLYLRETDSFRAVAVHNAPPAYVQARKGNLVRPPPDSALGQVLATHQVAQVEDAKKIKSYVDGDPYAVSAVELGGYRTIAAVPMLKDDELAGAILIYRQEVRPFSEKQIGLLQNFAAQAVIAIENARLLNELRQRTDDLSEALEQQAATSEVLQVISSSPGKLEPVFQAMLENALRICEAKFGTLFRFDGTAFHRAAGIGVPSALAELQTKRGPYLPESGTLLDRILQTREVAHSADYAAEPIPGNAAKLGGARSTVAVPMLKDSELVGAIIIYRQEVRPFTDKQIELVKNFAAQAVIAIDNARLLNDLNKLNQQLEQRVTDQVNEIERMGRLRRFLPPQVADLIVASGTEKQLESHRREITALFCDLRGFTGFSESSDPEDVMALLREYHTAIGGIINKYGGTLERYAGDGVMVVFNDPIPVDNPALQAVLMAIDMRAAIGTLIEKWRRLGHDIGFGIGIAHGFATLGTIGFEGRFDYAAIGTVSNVASRLCDEAKPGQILISPRVSMAVEKDIMVEPIGDFALKGIRRPLTAYNVLATKAAD